MPTSSRPHGTPNKAPVGVGVLDDPFRNNFQNYV